ncbi:MAG: hypothetical protein QOC82_1988 [Frankiaceae bacterium]|jgi:hypothetical protein|nr:hypothetical protein [Frankiaceae bacterium]MDQ1698271.1 hypothetical protein [Frankiaceae bacterium]
MTFWLGVATTYAVIITVGLGLGSLLASRFPRRNGGGGSDAPTPAPYDGPSLALADVPPLGSEFDRQFLPAAFADLDAPVR